MFHKPVFVYEGTSSLSHNQDRGIAESSVRTVRTPEKHGNDADVSRA